MTQRLTNAKEAANKPAGLQSHEDLARKLQVSKTQLWPVGSDYTSMSGFVYVNVII